MRSLPFFVLLALLSALPARAQRCGCGYCGANAIVVEPRDAVTGRVIVGLRLTLLDTLGVPVGEGDERHLFRDATSGVVADRGDLWSRRSYESLWFARGGYVLMARVYYGQRFRVRIEDVDQRSDGVFYDPVTVSIAEEDIYPLCLDASDWQGGEGSGFARIFHPVTVTLVRRDVQ